MITASIMGRIEIKSSHAVTLQADALAEDVDFSFADMIVLPGGLPETIYLEENQIVKEQCLSFARNKYVAAICAAPSVLTSLGLLEGKPATCHPAFEGKMARAIVTKEPVTVAGNIITGQGLGAGIPFALKLVEILVSKEKADKIAAAISYR